MKGMKINFAKVAHQFEPGNNEPRTQQEVQDAVAKKAKRIKVAKWTAVGVGVTGLTILGIKGIKKLSEKKAQQEVPVPEDQSEAHAEETEKKPTGKKEADK